MGYVHETQQRVDQDPPLLSNDIRHCKCDEHGKLKPPSYSDQFIYDLNGGNTTNVRTRFNIIWLTIVYLFV
jgi:hypothetical protein